MQRDFLDYLAGQSCILLKVQQYQEGWGAYRPWHLVALSLHRPNIFH
jgi:hypothetical protein